jgi:hypothetical protein
MAWFVGNSAPPAVQDLARGVVGRASSRISDWNSNSDPLGHRVISARGHQRRFDRVFVRPVYPLPKAAPQALCFHPGRARLIFFRGKSSRIGAYKAIRVDGCGVADFRPSF